MKFRDSRSSAQAEVRGDGWGVEDSEAMGMVVLEGDAIPVGMLVAVLLGVALLVTPEPRVEVMVLLGAWDCELFGET